MAVLQEINSLDSKIWPRYRVPQTLRRDLGFSETSVCIRAAQTHVCPSEIRLKHGLMCSQYWSIRTYIHTYIPTYIHARIHACMRTSTHGKVLPQELNRDSSRPSRPPATPTRASKQTGLIATESIGKKSPDRKGQRARGSTGRMSRQA